MKTMRKLSAVGLSALLHFFTTPLPAPAQNAGVDYLPVAKAGEYARYVRFLPPEGGDSLLVCVDADLVPVIYPVNRYDLSQSEKLDNITRIVYRVMHDPTVRFAYVWVGGSASPEGPLDNNLRLGRRRAEALGNFLKRNTGITDAQLLTDNLGEDWYSVERTLQRSDFPNRERILSIMASEDDYAARKAQIRGIDNGRTWHMLIRDVFPPLRNSRMMIVCHALPQSVRMESGEEYVPAVIPFVPAPEPVRTYPPTPFETRFVALKTNAVFWGGLVANLAFETELWRGWSLDIPVFYSPYDITPTWKIRLLGTQPELRRWFRYAGEGHFIGLHAHVTGFNVAINDSGRFQDPNRAAWGLGLGYGYAVDFGPRRVWGMEFNLGLGFVDYAYDAFYNRTNGMKFDSGSGTYWGITRAGISFYRKWRFLRY